MVVDINENSINLIRKICDAIDVKEYNVAQDTIEEMFSDNKEHWSTIYAMGLLASGLDKHADAIDLFLTANKIQPLAFEPAEMLCRILVYTRKITDGAFYAKLATANEGNKINPSIIPASFMNFQQSIKSMRTKTDHLSEVSVDKKRYLFKRAADKMIEYVRNNPTDFEQVIETVNMLNSQLRHFEALEVLELYPDNHHPIIVSYTAFGFANLGYAEEAMELFASAIESAGEDIDLLIMILKLQLASMRTMDSGTIEAYIKLEKIIVSLIPNRPIKLNKYYEYRNSVSKKTITYMGVILGGIHRLGYLNWLQNFFASSYANDLNFIVYFTGNFLDLHTDNVKLHVYKYYDIRDVDDITAAEIIKNDDCSLLIDFDSGTPYWRPQLIKYAEPKAVISIGGLSNCFENKRTKHYIAYETGCYDKISKKKNYQMDFPLTYINDENTFEIDKKMFKASPVINVLCHYSSLKKQHYEACADIIKLTNAKLRFSGGLIGSDEAKKSLLAIFSQLLDENHMERISIEVLNSTMNHSQLINDGHLVVLLPSPNMNNMLFQTIAKSRLCVVLLGELPENRLGKILLDRMEIADLACESVENWKQKIIEIASDVSVHDEYLRKMMLGRKKMTSKKYKSGLINETVNKIYSLGI